MSEGITATFAQRPAGRMERVLAIARKRRILRSFMQMRHGVLADRRVFAFTERQVASGPTAGPVQ
ncbi:hypothetical protein ACWD01_14880 [Streptomyces sp. NPDC002835]